MKNSLLLINLLISFGLFAQSPPLILSVSIDSTSQEVNIVWGNNPPDVEGYVVYKQDDTGLWTPLDTVFGSNNTTYTTTGSLAATQIEKYSVSSYDVNGNSSVRSLVHNTMLLQYEVQECSDSCSLSWNNYNAFLELNGYRILVVGVDPLSGMNVQEYYIDLTSGDTTQSIPYDYKIEYYFRVDAINTFNDVALSNSVSFYSDDISTPGYSYINKVSTLSDEEIEVSVLTNSADVAYFEIFRSYEEDEQKSKIGEAYFDEDSYVYIDDLVSAGVSDYYYSAIAVDICDKRYELPKYLTNNDTSNVSNLLIKEISSLPNEIFIEKGAYTGFLNQNMDMQLWKSVNNENEFLGDIEFGIKKKIDVTDDEGLVCVYLLFTESDYNVISRKDTVYSNKICVSRAPRLLIPTAFTPNDDNLNDSFLIFIDENSILSYQLSVYDDFGKLLFVSDDPSNSWDGSFNGEIVQTGSYLYQVSLNYADNVIYEDIGTVLLLH